jgi:hypothetical protein
MLQHPTHSMPHARLQSEQTTWATLCQRLAMPMQGCKSSTQQVHRVIWVATDKLCIPSVGSQHATQSMSV